MLGTQLSGTESALLIEDKRMALSFNTMYHGVTTTYILVSLGSYDDADDYRGSVCHRDLLCSSLKYYAPFSN